MIYADNAATTKLDKDAFEAMKPFFFQEFGNASQPYSFSRATKKALKQARRIVADSIGALPEEIYFTSGGTESDNWAIKGTMLVYGDTRAILTSSIEHHAVLNACTAMERMGYPVAYLPVEKNGILKPKTLQECISENTKLVSIMLANNEVGTIQPIKELAKIAHNYGALFHTDAVQAVGHIPINIQDLGVDMLSASAHKFNGPKGIGFLYIRKGITIQPYADGGSQEFGMRAGTENIAAIVAMAIALKKNIENISTTTEKLFRLEKLLLTEISSANIDFIRNGSKTGLPGNISLSFRGMEGETLLHRLDLMGICVSAGSACDSVNTQVSHVISAIGVPLEYAKGTIRISFGENNSEDDAISIAKALIKIINAIKIC
jgi:cysteine desulfurase